MGAAAQSDAAEGATAEGARPDAAAGASGVDWAGLYASAFVLKIREGRVAEYRRRHEAIWPELKAALRAGGIVHYTIWLDEAGRRVFGHMLRDKPPAAGAEDPAVLRWRAYMADVLEMEGERPARIPVEQVFLLTDRD